MRELEVLKLYEIREECELKIDELLEAEHEGNKEKAEQCNKELDILMGGFDKKVGNCILYYLNLKRTVRAVEEEIKELQSIVKPMKNKMEDTAAYVSDQMKLLGRKKVMFGGHSAGFQKSPQSVQVFDESQVPEEYLNVKVTVNKKLIQEQHKETGELVPGTDMVQGEHLRIR